MAEPLKQLSDELFPLLQKERFLLLSTLDAETGGPNVSAISWTYAPNPETIRFAVDNRSRILNNIRAHNQVVLTLFGAGSVYAVSGMANIQTELLADVPLKLACIEVSIEAVRDAMFYGSRISAEPEYEKTYDKRAAEKLDGQVMAAMKKA